MPDFNWENEETRQAIYNTSITFWLERGIDGFRIDTVNKYSKDISFPDAKITDPGKETQPASRFYNHGPRIHEFLGEMKPIFDRYDAMTVGELSHLPRSEKGVMEFVSARTGPLNMVFQFDLSNLGQNRKGGEKGRANFEVKSFKQEMSRWQILASNPNAWVTLSLENHDSPRSISRFDSDFKLEDQVRLGKMFAVIMATMTGTLFLYQGQEIGMTNLPRSWAAEEYKDVRSGNIYKQSQERCKGDSECLATALGDLWMTARDHSRLLMQWSGEPNAGFTSKDVRPWMRVHDDYEKKNADLQLGDPDSLLEFWKRILKLRKEYKDLFIYGRYRLVETGKEKLFVFIKETGRQSLLTVVNFSGSRKGWGGPASLLGPHSKLLIGNVKNGEVGKLAAWEGRVYLQSS
jgi:oligo-1,6-glucosidase